MTAGWPGREMMAAMSPRREPVPPADSDSAARPDRPGLQDRQALPEQSREDTDLAWGEHPEADEDDRFRRDRPPHWDSE